MPVGGRTDPDKTPLGRKPTLVAIGHNPVVGNFFIHWHQPVLLTISDQRSGVLNLTDPRMAAKKGVVTWGFCPGILNGHRKH